MTCMEKLIHIICSFTFYANKQTLCVRSLARSFILSLHSSVHKTNKTKQYHIINLSCVYSFIHSFIFRPTHLHTHIVFHQNQHRHLEVLQIVYSWPINSITRASRKSPIPHKFDVAAQWSTREGLIC